MEVREVARESQSNKVPVLSETPTLDECILYALRESRDVRAAYSLYQAALEKAPQVSVLPEPRLSYGYFINAIETRSGPMRHKVGLAQPIPWFGKLSLREEIATAEARAAYYSFLFRKNKLVSEVVKAFYELAYLGEAKSITEANLELLKRWENVLAQRYRSQVGTQANLIKVQVELGKLEDKLKELNEFQEPLKAQLNALLNRRTSSPLSLKSSALEKPLDPKTISISSSSKQALEEVLSQNNPELLLLQALTTARENGIALAEKEFYPDFSIGADYTVIGDRDQAGSDSGDDGLAAVFSISIPINFSKYRAGLREAKHKRTATKQMVEAKQLQLASALARNLFDLSDSKRRINLYKTTLVPKAEEALESTFTAFESGESSFLDLLDTERELLDFKLMLSRSQADLAISGSQLRSLLGDYSDLEPSSTGEQNE
jgi:outer membrane protein TolC